MAQNIEPPVDPGTALLGWWSQHEQQALAKAKPDDDEPDDEDDDDDDEDDGDEDDDLADLSEDDLRAKLRETREQLSKASGSSKKKRDQVGRLRRELEEARAGKRTPPKGDDDGAKPDVNAIREEARREERSGSDERVKRAELRGALRAAGVPAERLDRAVGLVKLADLDVDDDGTVDGIDDELDTLRREWPELFPKGTRRRERVAGKGDRRGDDDTDRSSKKTPSQLQAEMLTGRASRR